MENSLKSRGKIYQLARAEMETRVNSYNPLLLLIWKANLDVQFVAESSLALAQYVSGKQKEATCKIFGKKSKKTRVYTVVSGALESEAYVPENVDCTKRLTYYLDIISVKKMSPSNTSMLQCLTRDGTD